MNESVRQYKGREYVTTTEFANRIGCSRVTIFNRLKSGDLQGIHIDRSRETWLDWETQRQQWFIVKKHSGRKLGSKVTKTNKKETPKKKGSAKKTSDSEFISIGELHTSTPSIPGIPALAQMEEKEPKGEDLIDLSRINPDEHKDCWIMDGKEVIYNPLTGEPMLDYDKLKVKLIAQKYQLDLDEKRGKLIEKEELSRSMLAISHIMMAALNSIPQRYEALLTTQAETMTGHKFTAEERATIRDTLKNEAAAIAKSISLELEKMEAD